MNTLYEAELVDAIRNIPDADFAKAMDEWDKAIAREDPWAFKEFIGHYPTKADKEVTA